MSQAKVDSYKKYKGQIQKQQKRNKFFNYLKLAVALIIIALIIVWIGYSAYEKIEECRPREEVTVDYTAFDEYLQGLSQE